MKKILTLLLLSLNSLVLLGNDILYLERQEAYIDAALLNSSGNKMTLQAFRDEPIDPVQLGDLLTNLPTKYDPDFQIVELVRVLFYSNGQYDNEILPVLEGIPKWFNAGDTTRNYWSENHMIMWSSSEWLLHEEYGWEVDNTLYPRLIHYLELKRDYGFYEFFSSVYAPYTLSGLLNLYEFVDDPTLKNLAEEAAQRLLKDLLKPTTNQGVFFPAAGRNYPEKYSSAYGQNHSSLIYLLTGFGETPTKATHAGAFLATSTLPVDDVMLSWTPTLNTTFQVGHDFDSSFTLHTDLIPIDQLIFKWSSGTYAHPLVAEETFQTLADSSIWGHKDWTALEPLAIISPENIPPTAEALNVTSYSSVLTGHDIRLFKNNGVSLMSVHELWKGKTGFQQWPFAAAVGTTAVFTQAGTVYETWGDRDRNVENTHLPHVEQQSNLALIMYRPEPIPDLLTAFAGGLFDDKEVALYWEDDDFDEVVEDGNWILGRQDDNYVAVRRSCTGILNTWWACPTIEGQTWVVMVGNASMYGDFNNFQTIIGQSQFTEDWYYDETTSESVYYAEIVIDTFTVDYTWGVDSITTSIQTPIDPESGFSIYPNPTNEFATLDFDATIKGELNIRVFNAIGEEIYQESIDHLSSDSKMINTSKWQKGMFTILIENEGRHYYQKLIKY